MKKHLKINDLPLKFGKYKGTSPNDLLEIDPNYLMWMMKSFNNGVPFTPELMDDVVKVTKLHSLTHEELSQYRHENGVWDELRRRWR